jgi:hypothetical protein
MTAYSTIQNGLWVNNLGITLDGAKNRDKVIVVVMQFVAYKPFTVMFTALICVVLRDSRVALQRA